MVQKEANKETRLLLGSLLFIHEQNCQHGHKTANPLKFYKNLEKPYLCLVVGGMLFLILMILLQLHKTSVPEQTSQLYGIKR